MKSQVGKIWWERICLLYLVTWAISPPLQYGTTYRILCIFCYIIIELLALTRNKYVLKRQLSKYLFIIFIIVMTYLIDGKSAVNVRMQLVIFLLLLSIYDIYKDNLDNISYLLWWSIILCLIWNFCTLNAYQVRRNVSRVMAKNSDDSIMYAAQGIGGMGYVYSMVFMLPMVIRLFSKKNVLRNVFEKILCAAYIITTGLLILRAGYTIAIFIIMIGLAGIILVNVKCNTRGILIFTAYIAAIVIILNLHLIFDFLSNLTNGTMYYRKVIDIISSLENSDAVGNVYTRLERYSRSLRLFLESPIWGQLSREDVGKHSPIFDMFAQYGFFVGIWFCSIFGSFFKSQRRKCPNEKLFIRLICLMVITYSCLNNLSYTNGAIIGICFPIISTKLNQAK